MLQACTRRAFPSVPAALIAALTILACANKGTSSPDTLIAGDGGNGASSGGTDADGSGGSGLPGDDGSNGIVLADAAVRGDAACQHLDVKFLPKIPLVYVVVDRSGSMFQPIAGADGGMTTAWTSLRTATLTVIQNLESQVAFGFGAYTGINPNTTPGMCPIVVPAPSALPIALGNYAGINAVYGTLGQPAFKAETPAELTLELVGQTLGQAALQADAGTGSQAGGKYVLFVTDGETDFCDDGNPVCPADAVIAELQRLYAQGIQTLVLAISSNLSNISVPVLHSFANAGAGLPTLAPPGTAQGAPLTPVDIYNQCSSVPGWKQLSTAAGLSSGQALGTYAPAAPTSAAVYSPDATNVMDLTNKLSAALNTVKSCSFDLQGKIKVDLAHADRGQVALDGVNVPYDMANGWTMTSATQIDLVGSACQQWRTSGKDIRFDFPCDVLIVLQ